LKKEAVKTFFSFVAEEIIPPSNAQKKEQIKWLGCGAGYFFVIVFVPTALAAHLFFLLSGLIF
jgi:hypothetical protein